MTFDAILFEGDNPFELDDLASTIRLDSLSMDEIAVLSRIAKRSNIGMLLYPNICEEE